MTPKNYKRSEAALGSPDYLDYIHVKGFDLFRVKALWAPARLVRGSGLVRENTIREKTDYQLFTPRRTTVSNFSVENPDDKRTEETTTATGEAVANQWRVVLAGATH